MKAFHFTLEKLMDFREQELDRQKNTLGALRAELAQINEDAEELRMRVLQLSEELDEVCRNGALASVVSMRKRYIVTLQQEIHLKEYQAVQKQEEIEKQLTVVVEATKDVKTLEKLEEKQLEEYNKAVGKENEQFIEEFVSGQSIRSSQ